MFPQLFCLFLNFTWGLVLILLFSSFPLSFLRTSPLPWLSVYMLLSSLIHLLWGLNPRSVAFLTSPFGHHRHPNYKIISSKKIPSVALLKWTFLLMLEIWNSRTPWPVSHKVISSLSLNLKHIFYPQCCHYHSPSHYHLFPEMLQSRTHLSLLSLASSNPFLLHSKSGISIHIDGTRSFPD